MLTADQKIDTAEPTNIVIFGAAGDLSKRKLMPALMRMLCCGLVHGDSRILGVLRNRTKEQWIEQLREGFRNYSPDIVLDENKWQKFTSRLEIVEGTLDDEATYQRLDESLETLGGKRNAMFYCAVPPSWYGAVAQGLHKTGLANEEQGYRRLVIENRLGITMKVRVH